MISFVQNKTLKKRPTIAVLLIVFLLFLAPINVSWASDEKVKICVLAKRGIARCMEKWSPTAEYLTEKIPGRTFVIVPIDSDGVFSFVEHGIADFVLTSPSSYVELESLYGVNRIATLKNLRLNGVYTQFGGVIFCKSKRSDIQRLTDLKGKTFMGVTESSFGGWRMAWREFIDKGIDPRRDFKDLSFGGTQDAVVYAVRDDKVDAGTVRTDTLERMAIEGKINLEDFYAINELGGEVADLSFVHSTRSYPEWPFAKVKRTPDELAEKVATALLEMPWDCDATRTARCAGWTIPMNYQPVHECLKELKVGPYKGLGKITLADVFRYYWKWIIPALLLFAAVVFAAFINLRLNRGIKRSHVILGKEIEERKKKEEALCESEERFRDISYSMADWVWEVDNDGRYTFASGKVKEILGYDPKELIGKTLFELMPEDEAKRIEKTVKNADSEKKPIVDLEHWNLTKDGDKLCILTNGVPILNEKGDVCGYRGVDKDITERKRDEEALINAEAAFSNLFEAVPVGLYRTTMEGEIIDANPAMIQLLGYPDLKALKEVNTKDIVHPEDRNRIHGLLEQDGVVYDFEMRVHKYDGTVIHVRDRVRAVRDANDRILYQEGSLTDITERRQAREEHTRLSTAIEQAAESVVITDRDGTIQYVNPAFEATTGYSSKEVVGKNSRILKSGKHGKEFYTSMWETITNGNVWKGHFINKKKDGALYEIEATISPIKNGTGEIINFVAVKRDVTEEIKLEDKLRQAQKMEAIGTLAGGIAHDFNNILSAIMGYTELAEYDMPEGSKTRNNLRKVFNAGRRAKDLVKQILAFSRQGDQERKPLQISHIVKEALDLIRASLPATIEIRRNIKSDPGIVLADPTQIHQIIMNLCTNAAHAMNNNGGVLEVSLTNVELDSAFTAKHPQMNPGPYIKLTVSDSGSGMSAEVMERIFDPYFTTKEKGEGTGLGLAVVHGIVKNYGGAITIQSQVGNGSVFNIYFPSIEREVVQEKETKELLPVGNQRILFVDDEPALVDIGKMMLEHLGYDVIARTSSVEALEAFRNKPDSFDLIITDKTMPQMTGFDLARELKQTRPDIPIILCTGFSDTTDKDKAKAVGISGMIMKPVVMREMAESVKRVLEE